MGKKRSFGLCQKLQGPQQRCAFRPLQGVAIMSNRSDIFLHLCRILQELVNNREPDLTFKIPK